MITLVNKLKKKDLVSDIQYMILDLFYTLNKNIAFISFWQL